MINGAAFRLNQLIYQGTDSRVFSAESLNGDGDSAFVIKCCECPQGGEVWRKAMREIEAGTILRGCSNIVPLLGHSVAADRSRPFYRIFLLFDRLQCLEGMEITDSGEVLKICRDICLALGFMKKKRLIHGDVKPQNIYYDGAKWLLGDLGSVCVTGEVPLYGSEGYLSPEAFRGEPCDIRSDLYSLGIAMYKLLSGGRLPFCPAACAGMNESDVGLCIQRRLSGEAIPPVSGVSAEVNELLIRMCCFESRGRFRNPYEVAKNAKKLRLEMI